MRIVYLITLIFCFHDLMYLNDGLKYNDIKHTNSKDLVQEDRTGFYGSDEIYSDESVKSKEILSGYRNLNIIANTAPECIIPSAGLPDALHGCQNCIYFGPKATYDDPIKGRMWYHTKKLLVDCLMGKIKLYEQRSIQNTRSILQLKNRMRKTRKRQFDYDRSEDDYYR